MNCPACSHTQQKVGDLIFWCPRCGTLTGDGGKTGVTQFWLHQEPKLVERCRAFAGGLALEPNPVRTASEVFNGLKETWRRLGIAESINPPDNPWSL